MTTVRQGTALFENLGEGRFRERAAEAGVDYVGHASAPVLFDFDLDGQLDILSVVVGSYTTENRGAGGYHIGREDAFSGHRYPERTERSRLYKNLGGWRFEEVSEQVSFVDGSWSGDALIVDWNRDRYPDVFLLNMQGDDHYYENQAGKTFVDKTEPLFPRTSWGSMGAVTLDYDGDTKIDMFEILRGPHSSGTALVAREDCDSEPRD